MAASSKRAVAYGGEMSDAHRGMADEKNGHKRSGIGSVTKIYMAKRVIMAWRQSAYRMQPLAKTCAA